MGISTSPSRWFWWVAVLAIVIGAVLLVAPIISFSAPMPEPLLPIAPWVLAIVAVLLGAALAYVAFGPTLAQGRTLAFGIGLAGVVVAVGIVMAGADFVPAALVALGSVLAILEINRT
jgi:hypothetical protein